uniref:clp protease proteolytic subunit n=1 Tax=Habropetalum dawei TaxID=122300 RepID=UPI002A80C454|nr:clp protease proteolytic subunit [Habropetalum dawei]UZP15871.1 clp protease proteolytic subunit [Habropetalum dawei]
MPVGVPRVPFQLTGDEAASWVDVYNALYRTRLLFLCQEIDDEISNTIVGLMIYLNIESSTKDLYLFIHSPGGFIIPGMAMYDIMQAVDPDVNTICVGTAASMASLLLGGGTISKRLAFPHARVMIHQPASSYFDGTTFDVSLESTILLDMRDMVTEIYVERTGKPYEVIYKDLDRDVFMSATEAQAHGIIDLVADELG